MKKTLKRYTLAALTLISATAALTGCMDLYDKAAYTPTNDWTTWEDGISMCISADGSNADGNGRPEAPFKDIRYALTEIDNKGDPEESYTVYIIGTVTQTITISELPCKRIRIAGYPDSGVENVWKPENGGRCLAVNTTLPVEIRDLTFTGVTTGEESPISVSEGTELAIVDCQFKDNTLNSTGSFRGGGAIFNNGTVYIYGNTIFSNNTVIGSGSSGGGAIFNRSTGTLKIGSEVTVDGAPATGTVKFIQNEAKSGGAIYNDGGIVVIGGAQFTSNTTSSTGGAIHVNDGTISINHGTIISANESADGGGVYIAGGAIITMSDTTITSNEATSSGAGICNDSGTLTLNAGTIISENSAVEGAGVYNDSTFEMKDGVQIFANTASNNGGGVHNGSYGTFILSGGEIGKTGSANTAAFGGGVYNEGTFTMNDGTIGDSSATSTATLVVDSEGAISGSYANLASYGGGLYGAAGSTVSITGGCVSHNFAYVYREPDDEDPADGNPDWSTDPTHDNNYGGSGAGIWFETGDSVGSLSISGGTFAFNAVHEKGDHMEADRNGGALFLKGDGNAVTISDGIFYGNWARNGGAIYEAEGTLNITGGTFGCGVFDATEFIITTDLNSTYPISGKNIDTIDASGASSRPNIALDGGALLVEDVALCNLSGGTLCGNLSYGVTGIHGGGAVYLYGIMKMSGSAVVGNIDADIRSQKTACANYSGMYGGGIMVDDGQLIMEDFAGGGIYQNYSVNTGGGLYLSRDDSTACELKMSDGTIAYNTACETSGIGGGGITNSKGEVVIKGGTIASNYVHGKNNKAADGGGIYSDGTLWLGGSAVIGDSSKTVTATSLLCSNYSEGNGSAIYNHSESGRLYLFEFTDDGGIYYNYSNVNQGGALYNTGHVYSTFYTLTEGATYLGNVIKFNGDGNESDPLPFDIDLIESTSDVCPW